MEVVFTILLLTGALYVQSFFSLSSGDQGVFYRSLQISRSRLSSGARTSDSVTVPLLQPVPWRFSCPIACKQIDWCNLWCPDSSSATSTTITCHLFQMYVAYGYQETNTADAIDCYTANVKNYVVGASIEASPARPSLPIRDKYNLVDGIYDFSDINQCFLTSLHHNPYFKLDFGSAKPIRRVMILLQNNANSQYYYNIKVLVGDADYPQAEFSKYQLFGFFPGPSSASQEISFSYIDPILARYVVVQRMSDTSCNPDGSTLGDVCDMQICHILIN